MAAETALGPGDLLVAFTDGIVEARQGDEEFGDERTLATLARLRALGPDAIASGLLEAAAAFAAGGDEDDRAVLVARVKEAES